MIKDEIKEILDNLKYTAKKHTIQVLENGEKIEHCPQEIETELRLNTYSANILLDYITNLQEENKMLKEAKKKAIEYINSHQLFKYIYDEEELVEIIHDKEAKKDLLNIFQGDDKGEN